MRDDFVFILEKLYEMRPLEGNLCQDSWPFLLRKYSRYFTYISFILLYSLIIVCFFYHFLSLSQNFSIVDWVKNVFLIFFCFSSVLSVVLSLLSDALVYLYPGKRLRMFMLEVEHDAGHIGKLLTFRKKELLRALSYMRNYLSRIDLRIKLIFGLINKISLFAIAVYFIVSWRDFPSIFSIDYWIYILYSFEFNVQTGIILSFTLYAGSCLGTLSVKFRMQRHTYQIELLEAALTEIEALSK